MPPDERTNETETNPEPTALHFLFIEPTKASKINSRTGFHCRFFRRSDVGGSHGDDQRRGTEGPSSSCNGGEQLARTFSEIRKVHPNDDDRVAPEDRRASSLGPRPHLAALALESTHALLAPLGSHDGTSLRTSKFEK